MKIEADNLNPISPPKDQTHSSPLGATSKGTLQGRKFDESTNKIPSHVPVDTLYDQNLQSLPNNGNIIELKSDPEIILCKKLQNSNEAITLDFEFDEINAEILEMLDNLCSSPDGKVMCLTEENEIKPYDELTSSDKIKDQVLYTTNSDETLNLFFNNAEQAQRFKDGSTHLKFKSYLIPADKQAILKQVLINSLLQLEERKQNKNKESDSSSHISKDNYLLNEIQNVKNAASYNSESSISIEYTVIIGLNLAKLLEQLQLIALEIKSLSEKKKQEKILEKKQDEKKEVEKDILKDIIRADESQQQVIKFIVKRVVY